MPTSTEIFAHNLKERLWAMKKNQSDLARALNVTPNSVSRWVRAEAMPRANMIDRICRYLSCDPEDLLTDPQATIYAPEDIIASSILERPLLMQLFLMADKADDEAIYKCIKMLGEK